MSEPIDNVVPMRRDAHQEAMLLLPWYVGDHLDETERAEVDLHLADCAACRAELAFERRLAAEIAALPLEAHADIGALTVPRQPTAQMRKTPSARRGVLGAAKAGLPWVGWLLAADVLLVVGWQTLTPAQRPASPEPVYHALASPNVRPPADIAVIFRPQTTEGRIRSLLLSSRARLTDGPTAAGAWLLDVPMGERDKVVESLRGRPEVLVAEPLDPVQP